SLERRKRSRRCRWRSCWSGAWRPPRRRSEVPEDDDGQVGGPFWRGTISFCLVSVPVALVSANRSARTSLRMVSPDGVPLQRPYFSQDGRMLDSDDIVRGYELEKGKFVVVEDEELERLAPEKSRDIDLRVFVSVDQ